MKKRYRLYALPVTAENVVKAAKCGFARVASRVLIYTDADRKPRGAIEITDDTADVILTDEEIAWLFGCNVKIYEEFLSQNRESLEKGQKKFFETLEKELEAERRRKIDGTD